MIKVTTDINSKNPINISDGTIKYGYTLNDARKIKKELDDAIEAAEKFIDLDAKTVKSIDSGISLFGKKKFFNNIYRNIIQWYVMAFNKLDGFTINKDEKAILKYIDGERYERLETKLLFPQIDPQTGMINDDFLELD